MKYGGVTSVLDGGNVSLVLIVALLVLVISLMVWHCGSPDGSNNKGSWTVGTGME